MSQIVAGLGFILLAGWLLMSWIPSKRPLSELEQIELVTRAVSDFELSRLEEWRLSPKGYRYATFGAIFVGLLGLASVVQGATWRTHKEVKCGKCKMLVVGKKVSLAWSARGGNTWPRFDG